MITRIHIQNYRSFVDAEVKLRPFSLVIGANGAGKTNFLRAFAYTTGWVPSAALLVEEVAHFSAREVIHNKRFAPYLSWTCHTNRRENSQEIALEFRNGGQLRLGVGNAGFSDLRLSGAYQEPWCPAPIFNLSPTSISGEEQITFSPRVKSNGSGTAQVLHYLKVGDRDELFQKIVANLQQLVPEVTKLSFRTLEQGKTQIQLNERGLSEPLPASELSEGTRLILCILTIIHQEKPPPVILLEDIDRGMHPRIFEQVVPLMRDIAEKHDINIIATTHNPYLVDCFQDDKEAVIIVEKKDGASTLSTLASRLEGLDYDKIDPDDMPLGNLWYSGFVGGVPGRASKRVER